VPIVRAAAGARKNPLALVTRVIYSWGAFHPIFPSIEVPMVHSVRVFTGVLALSLLVLAAGCGDDSPTAPTPTPTPPPAPAPPPPPPPEPAALTSVTLNFPIVQGQHRAEGTITLTAAAPAGGAVISLQSSNTDVAKVPSNVTVAAGATTGTFIVDTSTTGRAVDVTITASYAGVTRTVVLQVVPPPLEPRFNVASASQGNDACAIVNGAGAVDCQLDASPSGGFPVQFHWNLRIGSHELSYNTDNPVSTPPTDCGFLEGGTSSGSGIVPMEVSLRIEDRSENRSSAVAKTVNVYTNGRCGY
jgi:hypothetical protein